MSKVCANPECSANILESYSHCSKCFRAFKRERSRAKEAKKRTKKRSARKPKPANQRLFASDGRVRVGMGLRRCAQLDYERKQAIGRAIVAFAQAINEALSTAA